MSLAFCKYSFFGFPLSLIFVIVSSKGPAVGNRIKPDVTGIGYNVVSAHSEGDSTTNQCGTISPAIGNSAALITSHGMQLSWCEIFQFQITIHHTIFTMDSSFNIYIQPLLK